MKYLYGADKGLLQSRAVWWNCHLLHIIKHFCIWISTSEGQPCLKYKQLKAGCSGQNFTAFLGNLLQGLIALTLVLFFLIYMQNFLLCNLGLLFLVLSLLTSKNSVAPFFLHTLIRWLKTAVRCLLRTQFSQLPLIHHMFQLLIITMVVLS